MKKIMTATELFDAAQAKGKTEFMNYMGDRYTRVALDEMLAIAYFGNDVAPEMAKCIAEWSYDEYELKAEVSEAMFEAVINNAESQNAADESVDISDAEKLEALNKVFAVTSTGWHLNGKEIATRAASMDDVDAVIPDDVLAILTVEKFIALFSLDEGIAYGFNLKKAKELHNTVNGAMQVQEKAQESSQATKQQPEQSKTQQFLTDAEIIEFYRIVKERRILYIPTRLHGELAKYNGKLFTMKLAKVRSIMALVLSRKYKCEMTKVSDEKVSYAMDWMVSNRLLKEVRVKDCRNYGYIPQYFITGVANWFMTTRAGHKGDFFKVDNK